MCLLMHYVLEVIMVDENAVSGFRKNCSADLETQYSPQHHLATSCENRQGQQTVWPTSLLHFTQLSREMQEGTIREVLH